MDMIWCFGRSLCFSRVCANKSGSGLCLVSEEILCESERDITRGEGLSTSPGSYNRQECWIIKTNPGRVECDGEPRQQSVGKLLRSDTRHNGHQMCSVGASAWCQLNMRCGYIWSSDISDHHQAHVSLVAEANNKRVDWLHSTHREPSLVRCVCRSLCLINNSDFIGCGEAPGGGEWFSICRAAELMDYLMQVARHWLRCPDHYRSRCDVGCERDGEYQRVMRSFEARSSVSRQGSASEDRVSEPETRDLCVNLTAPIVSLYRRMNKI